MVMSFPRNRLARVENEKVKKEVAKPGAIFLPPLQLISRKNAADPNNWEEADVWVIWFKWKESQRASNMMQQYLTTVEIACFVFKCGIWDRVCLEESSFPSQWLFWCDFEQKHAISLNLGIAGNLSLVAEHFHPKLWEPSALDWVGSSGLGLMIEMQNSKIAHIISQDHRNLIFATFGPRFVPAQAKRWR